MPLTLTIETGNTAMLTPSDMAESLRAVIEHLSPLEPDAVFGGPIRDRNGNTVGHYNGNGEGTKDFTCGACGHAPYGGGGCPNCGADS